MEDIEVEVVALTASGQKAGWFVLILQERKGYRRLPIRIGAAEAQAIALSQQSIPVDRPSTHDLMVRVLETTNTSLKKVAITAVKEGIFFAVLFLKHSDGTAFTTDARPSDGIALALRVACPVFVAASVFKQAGSVSSHLNRAGIGADHELMNFSEKELEHLLKQALEKEDYEGAARIKKAIEAIQKK